MKKIRTSTEEIGSGKSKTKKGETTRKSAAPTPSRKKSQPSQLQMDSALHESDKRFFEMLENIQLVAVVHDLAGRITFCNEFLLRITGYTRDEVLEKDWFAQFVPQVRASDKDKYLQELNRGKIEAHNESLIRTKNGEECLVRFSNTILHDEQGRIIGMTRLGEDATERWQAEEKVRESEERYRLVQENSMDGILLTAPDGSIFSANSAACEMFQMTEAEICQIGRGGLVDMDDPRLPILLEERARTGKAKGEITMLRKDGTKIPVEISTSIFINQHGDKRTSMTIHDISERKKVERQIRESQQLFSKIFADSPVAMSIVGLPDGKNMEVNDAWCALTGYSRDEVIGYDTGKLKVFTPQERDRLIKEFSKQGYSRLIESQITTKSGEVKNILISSDLITIEQDQLILTSTIEITARKLAEEQLRQSQELFSNVFHVSPAGITITRIADGKIIDANEAFLNMFEFSREEAVGHTSTELNMLSPEERGRLIQRQLETGGLHNFELLAHSKSGRPVNLLFSSKPLEVGGEACHITTLIDISERKQAEKKIELQNRRLKALREIDTAILSANSAESIIGAALIHIRELIECQRANLTLIDWEANESVIFNVNTDNETSVPMGRRFPLAQYEDIIQILSQNQILLMNDLRALLDPRPAVQSLIKDGLQSLCSLPLFSQGKLIGMFTMHSEIPGFFDEDKTALGREVANQVAIAITQKTLLEETRLSRDRLADLSRKLVEAQEKEARAIGRELHDQIGQMLTALKLTMELLPQLPPDLAAKKTSQAHELVTDLLSRVSNLSLELRPPMLDDLGLIPALTWHVNHYEDQSGIEVEFKHSGVEGTRFATEIETTAYRAVQEALTNVARHAEATHARLEVHAGGGMLSLEIEDNGKGFDPPVEMAKHRSSGLRGIRERASLVGGTFQIESKPGKGTKKTIQLPISKEIS